MSIKSKTFGTLPSGEKVIEYTLTNSSGAQVSILNYGGIIKDIVVPDRDGKMGDINLGYPSIDGYIENPGYLGALIGRVGNRINRGRIVLNGEAIQLNCNSTIHHLHGGNVGYDKRIWAVTPSEGEGVDTLLLKYVSPDGEENYPGELAIEVTYTWNDDCELGIEYEAVSSKDTICNMTNHTYFNLDGEGAGTIDGHVMQIFADSITEVDADSIPTGRFYPVEGTPLDLRGGKALSEGMAIMDTEQQMVFGQGYDHNFVLNGEGMKKAAVAYSPKSGRAMDTYTDAIGVQLYAGNMLDTEYEGKCGRRYKIHDGFCLETQSYPDSINHPEFPSIVLRAGDKYHTKTVYKFYTK